MVITRFISQFIPWFLSRFISYSVGRFAFYVGLRDGSFSYSDTFYIKVDAKFSTEFDVEVYTEFYVELYCSEFYQIFHNVVMVCLPLYSFYETKDWINKFVGSSDFIRFNCCNDSFPFPLSFLRVDEFTFDSDIQSFHAIINILSRAVFFYSRRFVDRS